MCWPRNWRRWRCPWTNANGRSAAFGAFTVDDVAALGITLAQLQAGITLLEQFGLLVTGANDGAGHSTITPSDYLATINTLRRVVG